MSRVTAHGFHGIFVLCHYCDILLYFYEKFTLVFSLLTYDFNMNTTFLFLDC